MDHNFVQFNIYIYIYIYIYIEREREREREFVLGRYRMDFNSSWKISGQKLDEKLFMDEAMCIPGPLVNSQHLTHKSYVPCN